MFPLSLALYFLYNQISIIQTRSLLTLSDNGVCNVLNGVRSMMWMFPCTGLSSYTVRQSKIIGELVFYVLQIVHRYK